MKIFLYILALGSFGLILFYAGKHSYKNNKEPMEIIVQDDLIKASNMNLSVREIKEEEPEKIEAEEKPKPIEEIRTFDAMGLEVKLNYTLHKNSFIEWVTVFKNIGDHGVCIREVLRTGRSEQTKSIKILMPEEEKSYFDGNSFGFIDVVFYINKPDGSILGFISPRDFLLKQKSPKDMANIELHHKEK